MAIQFVERKPTLSEVEVPDSPYIYDDDRFVYDEPCMFYDGGFDKQCLIELQTIRLPKKIVGRSGGTTPATPQPAQTPTYQQQQQQQQQQRQRQQQQRQRRREVLDIQIRTALHRVNDKVYDEEHEDDEDVKRYKLEYEPFQVEVDRIKHEESELSVYSQDVTSSARIPEIRTDKVKLLPVKTIVSSSSARRQKPKVIVKGEVVRKKNDDK